MTRQTILAIHLFALVVIVTAVASIALRDSHSAEIIAAALLGFVIGVLFDRWALRPVVDWTARRARA